MNCIQGDRTIWTNLSCQYSEAYWYILELLCLWVPSKVTRNPGGYLSMQRQTLLWNSLLSSYNAVHEILHSLSWKIKHLAPSRYQKEPLTFSGTLSFWNNDRERHHGRNLRSLQNQKSLELLSCNITKLPLPSAAAGLSARKSQEHRSKVMPLKHAAMTVWKWSSEVSRELLLPAVFLVVRALANTPNFHFIFSGSWKWREAKLMPHLSYLL